MATFAVLDSENVVTNIIVAETLDDALAAAGESCVEYTDSNPAGIGWTYDADAKRFMPMPPYPSWVFNRKTWVWDAPIPMPVKEGFWYEWNESKQEWVEHPNAPIVP